MTPRREREYDNDSVNELPISNFIQAVESSAKKILRDGKRNEHKKKNQKLTYSGAGIDCEQESKLSNHNDSSVHEKCRNSPFYQAWEEWNQKRKNEKDLDNPFENHRGKTRYKSNMAASYRRDNVSAYKGTNASRYNMKANLQSTMLRKRYRCDAKQEYTYPSATHPLHRYLLQHVNAIAMRIKAMTVKRVLSKDQVKDVNQCWHLNRDCLSQKIAREQKKLDRCTNLLLLSESSQIQSVPLHEVHTLFDPACDVIGSYDKFLREDMEDIYVSMPPIESAISIIDDLELSTTSTTLTPQCWSLINRESILYGNYTVSVNKIKCRNDNNSDEYWVIELHTLHHKLEKRYILLKKEVELIISCIDLTSFSQSENINKRKCVHSQKISMVVDEMTLIGKCEVWISVDKIEIVNASFRFEFEHIDSYYGMIYFEPTEIQCPVYEIMTRLHKQYLCKSNDHKFWFSEHNDDLIWKPIISCLRVNMMTTQGINDTKRQLLKIRWHSIDHPYRLGDDNIGTIDRKNIQWIQPSLAESEEYFNSQKVAYDLFVQVKTKISSSGTHQYFQGFDNIDDKRFDSVSLLKKRIALLPPMAMRLLHHNALVNTLIPGACVLSQVKRAKATFNTKSTLIDLTQTVAHFDRSFSKKGFPITKVNMLHTLEEVTTAPLFDAWDPVQRTCEINKEDMIDETIPIQMARADKVMKEFLDSIIDKWTPSSIVICDRPFVSNKNHWELNNTSLAGEDEVIFHNNGFRQKHLAHSIPSDSKISTRVFGVSKKALSPNQPRVTHRVKCSSKEYSTGLLSEERGSKDFYPLLQNEFSDKDGGSSNIPFVTTIFLSSYDIKAIEGTTINKYVEEREKVRRAKELKKKEHDLQLKILEADNILAKQLQDRLNKKISISQEPSKTTKSEDVFHELGSELNIMYNKDDFADNEGFAEISANIKPNDRTTSSNSDTAQPVIAKPLLQDYGWRKLPISIFGADFFEINKHKIQTCEKGDLFDKCNNVTLIGKVKASNCTDYQIDNTIFETKTESNMINNVVLDRMQSSQMIEERKLYRDKILNSNQEEALDYILNIPLGRSKSEQEGLSPHEQVPNGIEQNEILVIQDSKFMKQKRDWDNDDSEVILAAKHSNINYLKEVLDENGVDIDTYDEFGNTLFIIACQQGNKKMCKFLLRRGAYINAQNQSGNTGLHYLYEYKKNDLAEYLLQKGADDSYLNAEGLTCYEGVSGNNIDAL